MQVMLTKGWSGVQPYTEYLWAQTDSLRAAIDELEFLRRLGDGTLPLDAFRTYIEQDALYLAGYAKALALLAAKAPDPATAGFWANAAGAAATVESSLHHDLLSGGTLGPGRAKRRDEQQPAGPAAHSPRRSPACLGYVSYLTATAATEPYPVGAAAALPCFWIYADVGTRLAAGAQQVLAADPNHPYARWVTTYDAPEFQAEAARARDAVDRAAAAATDDERVAMLDAFTVATRYELLFWDTALHPQAWPGE